jgi:hypothetical protein
MPFVTCGFPEVKTNALRLLSFIIQQNIAKITFFGKFLTISLDIFALEIGIIHQKAPGR